MAEVIRRLRRYLLTGIVVLLPLGVTIYVLWTGFRILDSFLGDFLRSQFGLTIPGLGAVATTILILGAGVLATNVLGNRIIAWAEGGVTRIPLVRSVYLTTKQIIDSLFKNQKGSFKHVVMVEYPRQGLYSLGFQVASGPQEIKEKTQTETVAVFIPTSPNPTSGMMIIVPVDSVTFLSMSVEEGFKLIISGGAVSPQTLKEKIVDGGEAHG